MGVTSPPARAASTSMATSNEAAALAMGAPKSTEAMKEKKKTNFFIARLWPLKRKRAGRREPARPFIPSLSELRANAEEHAFAESLIADEAGRVVELEPLLVEEIDDVEECREVLVDVPAGRRVERAVVIVELRQASTAARGNEPAFTPVVRRAN